MDQHAAVHVERDAGAVGGEVAGEEHTGAGNVGGSTQAGQRNGVGDLGLLLVGELAFDDVGADQAGCDAVDALEAAHLVGYKGPDTQQVSNGVLLRADIHTLFDLGLLLICPNTLTISLASNLKQSSYAYLHGQTLSLPRDPTKQPSNGALRHRWEIFVKNK